MARVRKVEGLENKSPESKIKVPPKRSPKKKFKDANPVTESTEINSVVIPTVIGIGSSAGGLEALSNLIAALPIDLGFAYAIIQHLSPTHRSMMVQLLGRETAMATQEIAHGMIPEKNVIYITPPGRNVVLRGGRFMLTEEPVKALPRPSVNAFLTSLAAEKGEDAIGIILSGTGTDGVTGIREIKSVGGITFAQDPKTAKYASMPQSAIDSGCIDATLSPDNIAHELSRLARSRDTYLLNITPPAAATEMKKLLMLVKQHTRIDFAGYKEATLKRRIERRMVATNVDSIERYLSLVEANLEELERLCKDILISVTAFFRDLEAFKDLEKHTSEIIKRKLPGDEIRVWVAGCATGEEAYSIAILISEILSENFSQYRIQIFATDIDMNALNIAKKGSYPATSLAEMDKKILEKYFVKSGDRYEVSRRLRDMIIIARQDLVQDPPFLRLDLITCRNVLIYLQNELQAKVLSIFHYGLKQNGYLFLGKSEGILQSESLFEIIHKQFKIYKRKPGESRLIFTNTFRLPEVKESQYKPAKVEVKDLLIDTAIQYYIPPTVLINATYDIQHIHGDLTPFLSISSGKPSTNLQQLIRKEFRADLQVMVHNVENKLDVAMGRAHSIKTAAGKKSIRICVHPMEKGVSSSFFLVSFETVPELQEAAEYNAQNFDESRDMKALEEELVSTRERLQTVIEELETSNEEMQALNEEVQAANEELQSSNEELEAANEELQSTNEELTTVNEELQVRSGELAEVINDLEKIQNSFGFPVLVCNGNLELMRFNGSAAAIFSLFDKSYKMELNQLRFPPGMEDFSTLVQNAIRKNKIIEEQIFSNERHYLLQIYPYDMLNPGSRGAVITLMDQTERINQDKEIRENRKKLQAIMNHSPSAISLKDISGRYEFINREFEKIFGLSQEKIIGKTDEQVFNKEITSRFRREELAVMQTLKPIESEEVFSQANGERHLLVVRFPLLTEDKKIHGICMQLVDITDRKLAEEKLRLTARVFDRAGEGIVITDANQKILTVNEAYTNVTGYTLEETIGKTPAILKSGRHDAVFYKLLWAAIKEKGWWQGEIWNKRKSGEFYPEWLNINAVHDPQGNVTNYIGIFSDISIVKESQRRMEFLATHDEMTALPKRTLYFDRVNQAIERAKRNQTMFAIFFIDLDNFKVVNDSLGHDVGDKLLIKVGKILKDMVRASDTVSRFGGDEFALLMEDIKSEDADLTARRISEVFSKSLELDSQSIYASASIGISLYPTDGENADTLIKNADTAMYKAKEAGKRTYYFYTSGIQDDAAEKMFLSNGLRRALETDELFIQYQPQFDMKKGKLVGIEALVRWNNPEKGLILPGKFIPLAEKSGLIHNLGHWVADTACHQLATWQNLGYKIPRLAINFSADQFRRENLQASLAKIVSHYSVNPSLLVIELTESALMTNPSQSIKLLNDLKSIGLKISIDDFGTGFSSLSYLRQFSIDELKIDKSFVDEIVSNPDNRTITQAILAMAKTLGISVIAEGVELEEQKNALIDLDCFIGQGYYYSQPLKAEDIIKYFDK